MPIDLQYLLWLQDLRAATGGVFDEIFNGLSKFAVEIMPFLPFLIFWGLSRKWGYRFMLTHTFGELLNGIIKLTVCAYRPWIRSDRIVPAGDSKTAATGYSFPSGHSLSAGTTYGTAAVATWEKKRWAAVLCIVLILLTGFSRNFLGVHTPQDVIVGITEAIVMIFLIGLLMKWMDGNEKRADIMTVVGILLVIGALFYITLKHYPEKRAVDGTLLVDPKSMMNDSFMACGAAFFICRLKTAASMYFSVCRAYASCERKNEIISLVWALIPVSSSDCRYAGSMEKHSESVWALYRSFPSPSSVLTGFPGKSFCR